MKKQVLKVSVALAMLATMQVANANTVSFNNLGFETGDTTGWTSAGITGADSTLGAYTGTYYGYVSGASTLQQVATINAGDTVRFAYRFVAGDYLPYDDFAFYVGNTYVNLGSVSSVGSYGDSGWKIFNWVSPTSYIGPVIFGISHVLDANLNSTLLVDNAGAVPVPAAGLLFGSALLGAVGFGRRKEKNQAALAA